MSTKSLTSDTDRRGAPALFALAALLAFGLTACDSLGPGGDTTVGVAFQTASGGSASISGASASLSGAPDASAAISFSGTNGTLELSTAHIVVTDFALERANAECDSVQNEDACEQFSADPRFIELPLDGGTSVAVSQQVPADSYDELEFEVDDLEDDDGGEEHPAEQQLLEDIRGQFAEWPQDGSLRVTGTFTPADGSSPRDFTAYFEAEIEIEKEFPNPLVIEDGMGNQTVTVTVDPSVWFTAADGSVVDLSQYDFQSTGSVAEFEIEMENGFTELEFEG